MKYRVYSYDVWGNEKDGYEVNDCFYSGETTKLHKGMTDNQIIKKLKKEGIINKWIKNHCVSISGEEEYSLYFEYKGRPEFELRAEREEREIES